jgi:hypothetical protein
VCLSASISRTTKSGGAAWMYLTWALGLKALGVRVIWLEVEVRDREMPDDRLWEYLQLLRSDLDAHGLHDVPIALAASDGGTFPWDGYGWYLNLQEAADAADVFINLAYHSSERLISRFKRSVFVDTDPGVMQLWLSRGQLNLAPHHVYLTISETLGTPDARFPDCGLAWHHTPPPVYLPAWPFMPATDRAAPYVTVTNWHGDWIEIDGALISNAKSAAFGPYEALPSLTSVRLELAVTLTDADVDLRERERLVSKGWRIRSLWTESTWTVSDYQQYVQSSRGEFSCAKPFYVLLNTSWIADRTLHFLASGKPVVIQDTGPTALLPDAEGVFRFRDLDGAVRAIATIEADYEHHARAARRLAEERFDSGRVLSDVLDRVL